jgi:hypothetical protein
MIVLIAAHARQNVQVMQYLKIIPNTELADKHIPRFQRKYTLLFPICVQDAEA